MKQKGRASFRWFLWVGVLALCQLGLAMCAKPFLLCEKDANCAVGERCVEQRCVQSSRPDAAGDAGVSLDGIRWFSPDGKRPDVSSGPRSCTSADTCEKSAPHCHEKQCVPGFLSFDFKKGHFVIETGVPLKKCQEGSQCRAWQQCHLGFCRDNVGTNSRAKGKFLDDNLFLGEYSYSALQKKSGDTFLLIAMIGVYSDRIQYHLELKMRTDRIAIGNNAIDGLHRTAVLYRVQVDLSPRKRTPIAYASAGSVFISRMEGKLGARVSGNAELLLSPLSR